MDIHPEEPHPQTPDIEPREAPYSLLRQRLADQEKTYGRRWSLFLDIDGTVLREGIDNAEFYNQIEEGLWGLTYVTGTDFPRMVRLIKEGKIKKPLAASTNLGTRRFYLKESAVDKPNHEIEESDFQEDMDLKQKIITTGFDKMTLYKQLHPQAIDKLNNDPRYSKFNLRFLWLEDTFDAAEYEKKWIPLDPDKFDLYITVAQGTTREELNEYQNALQKLFPQCDVLMYHNRNFANKDSEWNVHLLPRNAWGKDRFVQDISKLLDTKGLIAGDSGNDVAQLMARYEGEGKDFIRAVVGGGKADLLSIIRDERINDERGGSLRKLNLDDTHQVRMYDERNQEVKGSQSILYLMRLLERAWRRFGNTSRTA